MLTVGQEYSPPVEIDVDGPIHLGTFSVNGEYLAGWREDGTNVKVWRVGDGKQVAAMEARGVRCLAVSDDGGWTAAGTYHGEILVWNASTRKLFAHKDFGSIHGVDFSPDSCRLVSCSWSGTAIVWDNATGKQVQTVRHEGLVIAAKYSPQGDRIATATLRGSVRVWDSNDGRLLVDIPVRVSPQYNAGLLWFHNYLFVLSYDRIEKFDASTGSVLSGWPVPDSNGNCCIALPKHGEFIAYSTRSTVTFWDTSTHTQLGLVQLPKIIPSIALSPDDQLLAIGGQARKITIQSLAHVTVSIVFLWIMAYLNMFLAPLVTSNRTQSHPLVYITLSGNLTSRSTLRCSTRGNTINSQTRRRY